MERIERAFDRESEQNFEEEEELSLYFISRGPRKFITPENSFSSTNKSDIPVPTFPTPGRSYFISVIFFLKLLLELLYVFVIKFDDFAKEKKKFSTSPQSPSIPSIPGSQRRQTLRFSSRTRPRRAKGGRRSSFDSAASDTCRRRYTALNFSRPDRIRSRKHHPDGLNRD